jgi:uncharacterized protein (TIGR02466 family)
MPQVLFKFTLDNFSELNESLLPEIYRVCEEDPNGNRVSNIGGWHSKIYREGYGDITTAILNCFKENVTVDDSRARDRVELEEVWFNINKKDHYNKYHTHGIHGYSGVYYVKTPENCGDLFFKKRIVYHQINHITKEETFKPNEGDVYFWASGFKHKTGVNLSNEDRVSLSFNLKI